MRPIKTVLPIIFTYLLIAGSACAGAGAYSFGGPGTIIGSEVTYEAQENESLIEIARKFDLGYNEIVEANPDIDPFMPGAGGKRIDLSTDWVIPDSASRKGIIINLSELRLYYIFTTGRSTYVRTFPIGIGRQGFATPTGSFTIIERIVHPDWVVPKSIRSENPDLPAVVLAGPDNPLGSYALRLSLGDVLIHGTNRPFGIGRKDSHGCIRMYPEDIEILFGMIKKSTKVTIVRQPVKIGVRNGQVYVEVHADKSSDIDYLDEANRLLEQKGLLAQIVPEKLYTELERKSGIPRLISK